MDGKGRLCQSGREPERVIEQDKELVGETLDMLQTCYQQLGKTDEWEAFCAAVQKKIPGRPLT